jgi:hypothetical protein
LTSDQQKKTGELNTNQQSEIGREKTTAIRLFEMIQKSITVIFVQLCVLLYSIMAFFKFYFEIVQVKKFNHSLMVGANHKVMNFHKKCHSFVALLIEALWDLSLMKGLSDVEY